MARVLPGQRWKPETAAQRNRWDESSEYFALRERLGKKIPDQRMPVPTELDVIKVQNLTGAQRAESEVVQLGAEIISNITRLHPWLEGLTPDSRCERYAVLRYPTGINRIRWAQVSGPTLALVDLTDGHKRCSPAEGLYHFVGDDDGPIEILWKPDETEGVHECLVEMEQVVPPSNYVAEVPLTGIPAREGLTPGRAVCTIWKLNPHDYTGPEEKTLVPILKPNFDILTKEIYNLSLQTIRSCGELIYIPVHREECGNWFASNTERKNTTYEAILREPLCPENRGMHAIESVEPWDSPEPQASLDLITEARNKFGRAAKTGDVVLIRRKFVEDVGSGGASCVYEFVIIQVLAQCRDLPMTRESSCDESGSGSGSDGDGKFLTREECGSGSGADESGSGAGCSPIQGYVQRKVAIETCTDEPELVDQLQLEMQDVVANMNMEGCPAWVNAAICVFGSCLPEIEEGANCREVCPEESGSGS